MTRTREDGKEEVKADYNWIRGDNGHVTDKSVRVLLLGGCAYTGSKAGSGGFYSKHRLNHFPINFKITKYDWRIYTKNRKENIKLKT